MCGLNSVVGSDCAVTLSVKPVTPHRSPYFRKAQKSHVSRRLTSSNSAPLWTGILSTSLLSSFSEREGTMDCSKPGATALWQQLKLNTFLNLILVLSVFYFLFVFFVCCSRKGNLTFPGVLPVLLPLTWMPSNGKQPESKGDKLESSRACCREASGHYWIPSIRKCHSWVVTVTRNSPEKMQSGHFHFGWLIWSPPFAGFDPPPWVKRFDWA